MNQQINNYNKKKKLTIMIILLNEKMSMKKNKINKTTINFNNIINLRIFSSTLLTPKKKLKLFLFKKLNQMMKMKNNTKTQMMYFF